jgi:hypothetical protein
MNRIKPAAWTGAVKDADLSDFALIAEDNLSGRTFSKLANDG